MASNPAMVPDFLGRSFVDEIIRSSPDAIITSTLDGVVTSWNPAAERIFGYAASEVIGTPIVRLAPDDRQAEGPEVLARISRGERVSPYETVRLRKDGTPVELSVTVSPLRDPGGAVVGISSIARDLSERKQVEARFLTTFAELRDIKQALDQHSIVAITDSAGRITYVNDKFCSISKFSRGELLGQDHRIINSGYHPKSFFLDLWKTISSGQVWQGEIRNRAKDGSHYWVATTIYPRIGANGRPAQYIAIRTDVTQRKADEANLQRFAEQLTEKNKELETIVYTVSHDLRSPLVSIQGFAKRLSQACDRLRASLGGAADLEGARASMEVAEAAIPQSLRFINAAVGKMDKLLAGLLQYSRLGREEIQIERVPMDRLIADCLAATRYQLEAASAEVEVSPLPDCLGDRTHLLRIFGNLIDNAIKYRDPSRPLRLRISAQSDGGRAEYTVADNGVGIAGEHQAKVFDIFHRLNPDEVAGEGLGLTIAQRLLERQRGSIRVESAPGAGASFVVSLPAPSP